ncbi:hypothetical protein K9692_004718 [Escherichia coli]|jgi:uncharacterized membrane protein YphA (DoxX/SURF4 family)|uniref:hypothetical protein n=1 Tax=Buttiauxella gaviniae TaxID=82990 RepID=UPI001DA207DC|nr:hypothetical protein [Escherichia coli]
MKGYFTPLVRLVLILCLLLLGLYSSSDIFANVPEHIFYSGIVVLLVIGTIVARAVERRKAKKDNSVAI